MLSKYEERKYLEFLKIILAKRKTLRLNFSNLSCAYEFISGRDDYQLFVEKIKSDVEKIKIFSGYIEKLIKKVKNAKKSDLKTKIDLLGEFFALSQTDIQVLEIHVFYKTFRIFENLCNIINDQNSHYGVPTQVASFLLQISSIEVSKAENHLKRLGFLYSDIYKNNETILSDDASLFFSDNEVRLKCDILDYFLGKPLTSDLKTSDFEYLETETADILKIIKTAMTTQKKGVNILFWGGVGTGKTEFTKTIVRKAGLKLYDVAFQNKEETALSRQQRLTDLVRKQTILKNDKNACFLFDEAEDAMNCGRFDTIPKAHMNRLLENNTAPIFWTTNNICDVDKAFLRRMTYAVEFKDLSDKSRLNIWKKELKKNGLRVDENKLIELNNSYNIPPALITNAINTTKMINGSQNDFEKCIKSIAVLINGGKTIRTNRADACENYDAGLVNANLNIENLTENIVQKGKLNFSLCLYGQSGTGKSAYARYLAKKLGIKVLLKKASDLMSPYVGQTEINIAHAFDEAKEKNVMLIIDEVDSFLQSRQNARHSWEISQVNEMLTCMEAHEYPFVCTTNLVDALDEASLRRFTFKIKFNFLNKAQIESAFKHFFKLKAPDEILSCYGLTSGDFAAVSKKSEYIDCQNNPMEYAKLLKEEVEMKSTELVGIRLGFN